MQLYLIRWATPLSSLQPSGKSFLENLAQH